MTFNPFNLFKGNPKVMELMTNERGLDQLLLEEAFVSEFKKTENEALQSYMTYERYAELVNFITVIDSSEDKNRAYKFPYVASEVLAVNNDLTYKFLLEEVVFTEEQIEEETDIEKEIDSESSDRSYSSIKSNNSNTPKKEPSESRPYLQADKENFILREDGDKTLSEMDFKDITEDDFPQVKQKRIVLVRQKVKRTVKRPYQPLVFRLLDFFSKQVVHILDGYVCRVLDSIINNRLQAFLAIIEKYSAFNQLKRIFSHLQSNSVQDFLLNFISKLQEGSNGLSLAEELKFIEFVQTICQISPKEWPKQEAVLDEKTYILTLYCSILQKINTKISSKLDEKKEQALDMAAELGEVAKILRKEHISRLIQIVKAISVPQLDRSPLLSRICLLYARLLKLILKGYSLLRAAEVRKAGNLQVMREMVQGCQECFDPIIPACFTFTFEDSLHAELPYKGRNSLMNKMQLLQVLGILAKENIYFSRRSMLDQPQFGHLLTLMDLHPNSSILHNAVLAILLPFFHSSSQPLLEKLFRNQNLFSQLFQVVKSDSEVRYQKKGKRKCFMAQITALCLAIDRLPAEDSQTLSEYKQSYEWQFIRECLIEDEQGLRKKVLGGHEKLRDRKPLIFFTKQQCLDHFRHFLAGVKLNLFDDFENYDPGNSDSEDQKQRQQRQREEIPFSSEHYEAQIDISPPQDDTKYFAEDVIL